LDNLQLHNRNNRLASYINYHLIINEQYHLRSNFIIRLKNERIINFLWEKYQESFTRKSMTSFIMA